MALKKRNFKPVAPVTPVAQQAAAQATPVAQQAAAQATPVAQQAAAQATPVAQPQRVVGVNTVQSTDRFALPTLTGNEKTAPRATDEAFMEILKDNFVANGYNGITKKEIETIRKIIGESLLTVIKTASFKDKSTGIYYRNVLQPAQVFNPPKGEPVLVPSHRQIKMQKFALDGGDPIKGTFDSVSRIFTDEEGNIYQV